MVKIVFRCHNCEIINYIPNQYLFRICKGCGKLTSYSNGEAFIVDEKKEANYYKKFLSQKRLTNKMAEEFFLLVEIDKTDINNLINKKEKFIEQPIIHKSSPHEIFLELIRDHDCTTLDTLILVWKKLGYTIERLESILKFMNEKGIIYHPKPWEISLT